MQRVDRDLPLAVDVQRLTARHEHRQVRAGADRLCDVGGCIEQMLEVVEHEQQSLVADRRRERVLRAERLGGDGLDQRGIGERGERHPPDPVVVVVGGRCGRLQREPCLPASTRPGQRDEPDVGPPQQRRDLVDLTLAAQKRRRGNGEVRLVQRLQRRECFGAELKEALRRAQVLQPVQPEVAHIRAGEVDRRLRQKHLPAVSGRRDPRRPVHVEPDVALVRPERLACVQPHPHAHRAARKRALRVSGSGDRIGRAREGDEEGIALRVDLDPIVLPPSLA